MFLFVHTLVARLFVLHSLRFCFSFDFFGVGKHCKTRSCYKSVLQISRASGRESERERESGSCMQDDFSAKVCNTKVRLVLGVVSDGKFRKWEGRNDKTKQAKLSE